MVPAKGPSVSVVRTTATTDSTGRTGGAASCSSSRQAVRPSSKASAIQAHFSLKIPLPRAAGEREVPIPNQWEGAVVLRAAPILPPPVPPPHPPPPPPP